MAKPDLDKQFEQIRERLIVLNREASVSNVHLQREDFIHYSNPFALHYFFCTR